MEMIFNAYNYNTGPPLWLSNPQVAVLIGKETMPRLVLYFPKSQLLREPRKGQNVSSDSPASSCYLGGPQAALTEITHPLLQIISRASRLPW